jgi:hypothetical protein
MAYWHQSREQQCAHGRAECLGKQEGADVTGRIPAKCPALDSAATPHHTIRIRRNSMRGGGRLGTATVSTPDTILNAAGGGRGVT